MQAAVNHRIGILTPGAQALFQDLPGRRQHKNRNGVRERLPQLCRTLYINVEHQVVTVDGGDVESAFVGAVIVAEDFGVFKEFAVVETAFRTLPG